MKELKSLLEPYNIICSDKQIDQFQDFFQLLVEWNEKMNLTGITEPHEVLIKHFFDSITPAFYLSFSNKKMIDIGAGAGFPSIPLKICYPELNITLLDSLNKRITFLKEVSSALSLSDVEFIHGRAEEVARNKKYRENFDIAISRAVARLNVLSELSLPFVKESGKMVALKGAKAEEEVEEAKKAFGLLGGTLEKTSPFELPNDFGERTIIIVGKERKTPKTYPRKPGTPNRDPII